MQLPSSSTLKTDQLPKDRIFKLQLPMQSPPISLLKWSLICKAAGQGGTQYLYIPMEFYRAQRTGSTAYEIKTVQGFSGFFHWLCINIGNTITDINNSHKTTYVPERETLFINIPGTHCKLPVPTLQRNNKIKAGQKINKGYHYYRRPLFCYSFMFSK